MKFMLLVFATIMGGGGLSVIGESVPVTILGATVVALMIMLSADIVSAMVEEK